MPVPDEFGVFFVPSRESKFCKGFNLGLSTNILITIIRVDLLYRDQLLFIGKMLVVKNNISDNFQSVVMDRLDAIMVLLFGAIPRSHCSFLIKLPEVI